MFDPCPAMEEQALNQALYASSGKFDDILNISIL
jgi:hypothetical protein